MRPRTEADWDLEWLRAWKAHAANPWFAYQADAYAAWVRGRALPRGPLRVLKTDAFDEACGFHHLPQVLGDVRGVLMDVSPLILSHATQTFGHDAVACVTDVRRLAFRPASFDLVFSPSTLDHFADRDDIGLALREIVGVLRPGARLLIALDNPANPILRTRQLVHWLTGSLGGLIPFRMGRTLSRARLVAALERERLEVLDSGYLLHAPRILGLWIGEWVARRHRRRLAGRLRALLRRLDRLLGRLPTQRWTGHFVVADCRRPAAPSTGPFERNTLSAKEPKGHPRVTGVR